MANETVPLSVVLRNIQQDLVRYVYSTYAVFGITGCILNILLFSRRQFRTSSCCACKLLMKFHQFMFEIHLFFLNTDLLAMSVAMVAHLSMTFGIYLHGLNNVDPTTTISAVCKLRVYILQSTAMMYRWCLTAACLDRYALSAVDARFRNFASLHIARRVIVSIILIWIVLPIHGLIFYNLKGNICGIFYSNVAAYYHSIFTTMTGAILPIVTMAACALLTHRNLVLKRQRRGQLENSSQASSANHSRKDSLQARRDQQVLIMLVVQVLIYAILMTPLMVWYFYKAITLTASNKSSDHIAIENFAAFIAELFICTFPTSSFYLYTMSSQMFRTELMILIRSVLTCKWSNNTSRIEPTPATRNGIGLAIVPKSKTEPIAHHAVCIE